MLGHKRALAALVLVLAAAAAEAPAEGKWQHLFNGKDLAGWKPHGAERWTVDKGEILGETLTKEYGYLSTDKTYRDFELKAKFKAEGAGNSGIFFHSSLNGRTSRACRPRWIRGRNAHRRAVRGRRAADG